MKGSLSTVKQHRVGEKSTPPHANQETCKKFLLSSSKSQTETYNANRVGECANEHRSTGQDGKGLVRRGHLQMAATPPF